MCISGFLKQPKGLHSSSYHLWPPTGRHRQRGLAICAFHLGFGLVTPNLPFDEWTEVFGSKRPTGALLDRLTHHVHILEMNSDSYRLRHSRQSVASQVSEELEDSKLTPELPTTPPGLHLPVT